MGGGGVQSNVRCVGCAFVAGIVITAPLCEVRHRVLIGCNGVVVLSKYGNVMLVMTVDHLNSVVE